MIELRISQFGHNIVTVIQLSLMFFMLYDIARIYIFGNLPIIREVLVIHSFNSSLQLSRLYSWISLVFLFPYNKILFRYFSFSFSSNVLNIPNTLDLQQHKPLFLSQRLIFVFINYYTLPQLNIIFALSLAFQPKTKVNCCSFIRGIRHYTLHNLR